MKQLALLLCSIFIVSCSNEEENHSNEQPNEKNSVSKLSTQDSIDKFSTKNTYNEGSAPDRIDVSMINGELFEDNFYLLSFSDSVLSACSYLQLYELSGLNNQIETSLKFSQYNDTTYVEVIDDDTVHVHLFYDKNNRIEWRLWTDAKNNYGIDGISRDSYIVDDKVVFNDSLQIGMAKNDFFEHFFTNVPDTIYQKTKVISIAENEMGEDFKNFHFKNDTLIKISFEEY